MRLGPGCLCQVAPGVLHPGARGFVGGATDIVDGINLSTDGSQYISKLDDVHSHLRSNLEAAIEAQKASANQRRSAAPSFKVGDKVLLNTKNIRTTRPTRKFAEKFAGPFEILQQVSTAAFKLLLPPSLSRIHPVFHVSLLEPVQTSSIPGRTVEAPPPTILEGEEVWSVKAIVDSRWRKNKKAVEYRVEWLGFEDSPDRYTWEPAHNLLACLDLIDEFHASHPEKPGPL